MRDDEVEDIKLQFVVAKRKRSHRSERERNQIFIIDRLSKIKEPKNGKIQMTNANEKRGTVRSC